MSRKFKIASISIEFNSAGEAGYWVRRVGTHAEQGGNRFGDGEYKFTNLQSALNHLGYYVEEDLDKILNVIKDRVSKEIVKE